MLTIDKPGRVLERRLKQLGFTRKDVCNEMGITPSGLAFFISGVIKFSPELCMVLDRMGIDTLNEWIQRCVDYEKYEVVRFWEQAREAIYYDTKLPKQKAHKRYRSKLFIHPSSGTNQKRL